MSLLALSWAPSLAFAQPALQPDMMARCHATHILQGELVRVGTPTAQIAAENADFWRAQAARKIEDGAQLEALLSTTLDRTRAEAAGQPAHGFMQIAMSASVCQTLRADIQPGYDPVQQNTNRGN